MASDKVKVKIGTEEKEIVIKHPTPRIEAEANMYASKVFSKLIKQKKDDPDGSLLLRAQLDEYLKDMGLYTDEDIDQIKALGAEVEKLETSLIKGGIKKQEGREIAINLRRARLTLLIMLAKRLEYDKNTIEHHSENARVNYIISKCLCDENGAPIFNSVEDYEFDETSLKSDLDDCIRKIASMCSTYDQDYESKLVENKFLKKFGFCNDKFDLVDANGNLVNEKGQRIDSDGNLLDDNGNVIVVEKEVGEFLED